MPFVPDNLDYILFYLFIYTTAAIKVLKSRIKKKKEVLKSMAWAPQRECSFLFVIAWLMEKGSGAIINLSYVDHFV